MNLALIKEVDGVKVVENVIVVEGDGSVFFNGDPARNIRPVDPKWLAQYAETRLHDPKEPDGPAPGDIVTKDGYVRDPKRIAAEQAAAALAEKERLIALYAKKQALEAAEKDGHDVAAELVEARAQVEAAKLVETDVAAIAKP